MGRPQCTIPRLKGKEVRPVEDPKVPAYPKGDDRQSQSKGKGRVHRQGGSDPQGEPYPEDPPLNHLMY